MYEANATLKYDVVVHPGGNPSDFKVAYSGQDRLTIVEDRLIIETSLGEIIEGKPKAYQIIDGKEIEVACFYRLDGNTMQFILPDGYDQTVDLSRSNFLYFHRIICRQLGNDSLPGYQ